jgi:hypothetical protein
MAMCMPPAMVQDSGGAAHSTSGARGSTLRGCMSIASDTWPRASVAGGNSNSTLDARNLGRALGGAPGGCS